METPFSEELQEKIRLNSFGRKIHTLILNNTQLILNNITINLNEIGHCKFGIKRLQLGMFPIGWSYQVSLKTASQELNLVLRSFLGVGDAYLEDLYQRLVNGLWLRLENRLLEEALTKIKIGNSYTVGNCVVSRSGVTLGLGLENFEADNRQFIPWLDLYYQKKYDRLVINSKSKRHLWLNLYFLEHWNAEVLMDVLDYLFEEGGLRELNQQILPEK